MDRNEAIDIVRKHYPDDRCLLFNEALETLIPELAVSEDERIRKELLNAFQESEDSLYMVLTPHRRESFIAWLEKQGEQKPAEWGKEDEDMLACCEIAIDFFKNIGKNSSGHPHPNYFDLDEKIYPERVIEWLKSLKDRIQPQSKQEWSEEDENMLNNIIGDYSNYEFASFGRPCKKIISWLKSIKERYAWKPSDEQLEALDDFIYAKYPNIEKHGAAVKLLYQDLKKLK